MKNQLLFLSAFLLTFNTAQSAVRTWDNGSGDQKWSTGGVGGNWSSDPAPGVGDTAQFPALGPGSLTINVDTAGISVDKVQFLGIGGIKSLTGNTLAINDEVIHDGGNFVFIQCPVDFGVGASITFSGIGNTADCRFTGPLIGDATSITMTDGNFFWQSVNLSNPTDFTPNSLTMSGGSTLTINMTNDITFSGAVSLSGAGTTLCTVSGGGFGGTISALTLTIGPGSICASAVSWSLGGTIVLGTFSAGCSVGTANLTGNLFYGATANSEFELDQPNVVGSGVNDLIDVDGSLTLDGQIDIVPLPNFGSGTYRLFSYSGSLTNNGATFSGVPAAFTAQLDLSTPNQVNLVVTPAPEVDIDRVGNDVVLSWTLTNFQLQANPFLGSTSVWTDVPGSSPVAVPITNSSSFFRLRGP